MQALSPFRRGNEAIAEAAEKAGMHDRKIEFICECDDPECLAVVPLTLNEFRQARDVRPGRITAPDHAPPTT